MSVKRSSFWFGSITSEILACSARERARGVEPRIA